MTTTKSTMTWVERIIRRFLDTPGGARALRSNDELLGIILAEELNLDLDDVHNALSRINFRNN